jgi:hypothetical protein
LALPVATRRGVFFMIDLWPSLEPRQRVEDFHPYSGKILHTPDG